MSNYNPNLVKIHRSYTIEEAAGIFGIHKNTVSQWLKNGLPFMSQQKPYLILGDELKQFLQTRRKLKKQKCNEDEMYCVRCKKPSKPAENFVEYVPQSIKSGRLTGFCSRCECLMNKMVSLNKLEHFATVFDLSLPQALKHINDRDKPLLNSDFK
jgi:hypothetical protein